MLPQLFLFAHLSWAQGEVKEIPRHSEAVTRSEVNSVYPVLPTLESKAELAITSILESKNLFADTSEVAGAFVRPGKKLSLCPLKITARK